MSDEPAPDDQAKPRILRPWEADPVPPITTTDDTDDTTDDATDDNSQHEREPFARDEPDGGTAEDFNHLESGPTSLDSFSNEDYRSATTREYRGLAEEIAKAASEDVERQAVSASMPGVGSGLIGFDDVTGVRGPSEEEVELEEQQRTSDLTVRVGTAVVLVGIFLGSLLMGSAWFTAFVLIVMVLSLGEFYATARARGYAPAALFGFLGMFGMAIGTLRSGVVAIGVSMTVVLVIVGLFFAATGRRNPVENAALTVMGAGWVGMLAFAVVIVRDATENPQGLILFIVVITVAFDAGSYFAGRAFGRRHMAPRVSPKKTWEGYIGGVITAMLLAAVLSTFKAIFPVTFIQSMVLTAMVVVLAPLGDAAESVVKRSFDVKDMGLLLPGHGGMLDRIDALLFVVPGAYVAFGVFGFV
jgi:phosphatidate cytidylyltransferase